MKLYGVWELYDKKTPEKFFDFSNAYLYSAERLCKLFIRSTNKASFVRGSVVQYLTFHSIELFLKGAILSKNPNEKLSHDLNKYYNKYNKLYPGKQFRIDFPFRTNYVGLNPQQIKEVKKQIPPQDQVHKYPTDKNGKEWPCLYAFEPIAFLKIIEQLKLDFIRIRHKITISMDWPRKDEREEYEIIGFINNFKNLPEPREFEIIEKRERPDYFIKDINTDECFGVELTSVYLSDRSVPDEHIKTLDQGILFEGIPFSREEIEEFKIRILNTISEKVKKAKSGYDLRYPLILSVYVNEYRAIYINREEWSQFITENGNVFDFVNPFIGVFFWSLGNGEAVLVKPSKSI